MKVIGEIIYKKVLAQDKSTRVLRIEVISPDVAKKAQPGQFVVVMVQEEGERIPLTIVDTDPERGAVTLIFQEVGLTTHLLGRLKEGDFVFALSGPLGHATPLKNYGRVILVGGGVGIAEIYPVARGLKEAGSHLTVIIGARTRSLLILEEELKGLCDKLHVMTDDGSRGFKGFTTDLLKTLLHEQRYAFVYCVGPIPMMQKAASVTQGYQVETRVSLNALMVDGTGMCGSCRVTVSGQVKFSCVDGPEFDAHAVDWEELAQRSCLYAHHEKEICRLYNVTP
jgi:ferredoxin--NADP+ reductase